MCGFVQDMFFFRAIDDFWFVWLIGSGEVFIFWFEVHIIVMVNDSEIIAHIKRDIDRGRHSGTQ